MDVISIESRKAVLFALTKALAQANLAFLIEHPGTPRLYQLGPAYALKLRPFQIDGWADLVTVYARREGDCKDFVAIRLAEEWNKGNLQCAPWVTHQVVRSPQGGTIIAYHVQLACGGSLEDPSALLGMPKSISAEQLARVFT